MIILNHRHENKILSEQYTTISASVATVLILIPIDKNNEFTSH